MARLNNHPAFPVPAYPGDGKIPAIRPNSGMAIRDWFAGMAMQGLLAGTQVAFDVLGNLKDFDRLAKKSYEAADAMLVHRDSLEK